ncbi:hypothetical protein AB0J84_15535 [Micromonospora arborensis]|uniref:hypothetical protein n=1 Tax=Micromonospora arborensis TaxID=2116518 RepID=UPI003418F852
MRKPAKTAAVLFGLGVGAAVGPSLGPAAAWSGVTIAALGVVLSLVGTTESHLVEDGLVNRDEAAAGTADGTTTGTPVVMDQLPRDRQRRATFSSLGPHVEQIIKLAEQQANDILIAARLEAEGIVAGTRREAEALLNRAHEQAAGIAGTHWEAHPTPPTQALAADEDPSRHA